MLGKTLNSFRTKTIYPPPYDLEFGTSLYHVDHLAAINTLRCLRLDAQLGWQPTESLAVSVGVKNLLDDQHLVYGGTASRGSTEIECGVYFKID